MKLSKSICSVLLVCALTCSLSSINVNAANITQDGLEVSLTVEEKQDDKITANLDVTNTNSFDISNVSLEEFVPNGYKVYGDSPLSKSVGNLKANETTSFNAVFVVDSDSSDIAETNPTTPSTTESTSSGSTSTVNKESDASNTSSKNSTSNASSNNNSNSNGSASKNNDTGAKNGSPDTGEHKSVYITVLMLIAAVLLILSLAMKKKTRNTMLSIALCIVTARAFSVSLIAEAADTIPRSISISETIEIDQKQVTVNAVVRYNMMGQDTMTEADKYYQETSDKILSTEYANENNTLSEKEVYSLLTSKNINQYPISYEYDLNGTYVNETEVDVNSDNKHPIYQTFYQAENGDLWNVFVVGRSVYASALSYNFESDTEIEYIFGEDDTLVCYADSDNKYYFTIPKDTAVSYHVLETLNADALDKLTFEEIDKL